MLSQVSQALRRLTAATALCAGVVSVAAAQGTGNIRGRVTDATENPVADAQISVVGTRLGTVTSANGTFIVANVPAGAHQVMARRIGYAQRTQTVTVTAGGDVRADFQLAPTASQLEAIVVTALGQQAAERSLGVAQQTVQGEKIAQTGRENFVNALQGRIAGVDVVSTSGTPGASTSITIRGVSSISSSNQPLMIIDGLPMDNKTLNTAVLASDAPSSLTAFNNRGVDFTNRGADINPEDIETLTVLKGPEASALYGIDAANGAIVITTKRGKAGQGGWDYSSSVKAEQTNGKPFLQREWGPSGVGSTTFLYYGARYADTTTFYNNIDGFFRTAVNQQHNLAFSGAAPDGKVNYRLSSSVIKQAGIVPNEDFNRINLTGASQAQVKPWLNVDVSMNYAYETNNQTYKGDGGPLLGLMVWPQTDNASDWITPAGTRRRLTNLSAASEVDNPYFNVNKNKINAKTNRLITNVGFLLTPFSWGSLRTNLGSDTYTNQNLLLRNPESAFGYTYNGVLDVADDITRNLNAQTLLNINSRPVGKGFSLSGFLGNSVADYRDGADALKGQDFLDPNFVSINNTNLRTNRTTLAQRRLVSAFGQATVDYRDYLYVNVTGRNDWTSTIPQGANSFFYPSVSSSFIFSDAVPAIGRFMSGKLRAAYAEVGRDAQPYSYRPSLEYKTTSYGGYGYGFYGPNLALEPEFAKSYELGTELGFLHDRLGVDATVYRKETQNQIVQNVRGSYGTGYILFNLNGATTRNQGLEVTLRGTPVMRKNFSWDGQVNFDMSHGKTLSLPHNLPESYVSDTWLYGNVRAGTQPGLSTMSLTGYFYQRNKNGDLLIDPTTGLPIRDFSTFKDGGYDRQPKFTMGVSNTFNYKRVYLDMLMDIRRGGDVFNATEHYLTTRGLSKETLDRETPRVIKGVLRDGNENSANPTPNNIVVVPALQTAYYTGMSEELFIEKNINWFRLRDVTLRYALPERFLAAHDASVFVRGTDLFLKTNYTGLDPVVNGNTAAVGGSGGVGIDYGNFPIPRGYSFGLKLGF